MSSGSAVRPLGVNPSATAAVLAPVFSLPLPVQIAEKASVGSDSVNVRNQPPHVSLNTFVWFRLTLGAVVDVLHPGARMRQVGAKEEGEDEWFRIRYKAGAYAREGWVRAGTVGERRHLRLDVGLLAPPAEQDHLRLAAVRSAELIREAAEMIATPAHAQGGGRNDGVTCPTKPLATLLIPAVLPALFVASQIMIRKFVFPDSAMLTFASSLGVPLILGVISMGVFSDLIVKLLTSGR